MLGKISLKKTFAVLTAILLLFNGFIALNETTAADTGPTFEADEVYRLDQNDFDYPGSTNDQTILPVFWFYEGDLYIAIALQHNNFLEEDTITLSMGEDCSIERTPDSYADSYEVEDTLTVNGYEKEANEEAGHNQSKWEVVRFDDVTIEDIIQCFNFYSDTELGEGHQLGEEGTVDIEVSEPENYELTVVVDPENSGTATDETDETPYEEGEEITIEAEANEGYEFVNWTTSAGTLSDDESNETTFTMPDEDVTVTANFEEVAENDNGDDNGDDNGNGNDNGDENDNQTIIVEATKIICEDENNLPKWGDSEGMPEGHNINPKTIGAWVADTEECDFFEDEWQFQWAYGEEDNPGDNEGVVNDGNWHLFSNNEPAEIELNGYSTIALREVMRDNYLPFSEDLQDDESAEFYCHDDVYNYDNLEYIQSVEPGKTYHCAGFNVKEEEEAGSIEIIKDVGDYQGEWSFDFSVNGDSAFALDNENDSEINESAEPGKYVVREENIPAEWNLDDISCKISLQNDFIPHLEYPYNSSYETDLEDNSVTIGLAGEEKVTCTFENNYDEPEEENGEEEEDEQPTPTGGGGGVIHRPTETEEVTVTFDENYEDGTVFSADTEENTSLGNEMPEDPERENYVFVEWNTGAEEGGTTFNNNTEVNDDTTVYAIWGEVLGEEDEPEGEVLGETDVKDSCPLYLTEFIRQGRRNNPEEVEKLQTFLNEYEEENLSITGFYSLPSIEAVKRFQSNYASEVLDPWGIDEPTGFVYLTTRRWINLTVCPELEIEMPELISASEADGQGEVLGRQTQTDTLAQSIINQLEDMNLIVNEMLKAD